MRSSRRLVVVLVVAVVAVVAVGASAFASWSPPPQRVAVSEFNAARFAGRPAPPPQRVAVSGVEVVSGPGAGELSVTWDVHDAGPVNYRVSWRPAGERFRRAADVEWNAFRSGAEHVISGLVPGGVYEVRVRARFGGSGSRWSDVVSGAAAAHTAPAQDLAVPQSISAPVPEEPLEHARAHQVSLPELRLEGVLSNEGDERLVFEVILEPAPLHDVTFNWSTSIESDDTAEADDFEAVTDRAVTIPAAGNLGLPYVSVFFSSTVMDDVVYEGDETVTVKISNVMNATIVDATVKTTIVDNESEPTISIADASAAEGDEMRFEVTLSGPAERVVSFRWAVNVEPGDTAALEQDVVHLDLPGGLSAGATRIELGVVTIDDSSAPVFEDDETFTVTIRNPIPYATILDGVAKGTIVDDEPVPTASLRDSSLNMHEGENPVLNVVVIHLSPVADRSLEVELVVSGTAEPDVDYVALPATVTLHRGVTEVGVPVTISEDDVYETVETIDIAMVAVGSDIRVDPDAGSMQIMIADNDPAPLLSVHGGTGTEGGQNHGTSPVAGQDFANVVFELELSGQVGNAFTVKYETVDGTARAGADYTAVSGTATIPMGQTSAFVLVPVIDDDEFEGSNAETVGLRVFDASHPLVLQGSTPGSGFVADDEEPPVGADYVGQTVDTEGSVAVGESWYHGRTAVNGRIEYRINARRDVDWYEVDLAGGSCYEIDVRGATTWQRHLDGDFPAQYAPTEPLTLAHPFIQGLYDTDGNYVEGTQDKGYLAYPESTVTLRPRQGGTYYIAVTNRIPFEWGTFDLSVIDLGSATLTCTDID